MTTVIELPPPMQCIACGRTAQYVIDGTSWCRIHAPIQPKES